MRRPELRAVELPKMLERGKMYVTCSPGQWDGLLAASYDCGATLLEVEEVDGEEKVVRAWRKEDECDGTIHTAV